MKLKMMTFAALAATTLAAFAQHTVTAKLSDLKDGEIMVRYVDLAKRTISRIDTVAVKDGTFYLDAKGDKALFAEITVRELGSLPIFVVPGEQGVLSGIMQSGRVRSSMPILVNS